MTFQGAIKQLHELRCNEDMPIFFKPAIAEVINVLLMDAKEVRHGRWIPLEKEIGLYECSICGHKILRAECNYCPNCGASMVNEDD